MITTYSPHFMQTFLRVISLVFLSAARICPLISSLCISKPYHVVGVDDLVLLLAQFTHDVVARVLRLVRHAVHHAQAVGLVLGIAV